MRKPCSRDGCERERRREGPECRRCYQAAWQRVYRSEGREPQRQRNWNVSLDSPRVHDELARKAHRDWLNNE